MIDCSKIWEKNKHLIQDYPLEVINVPDAIALIEPGKSFVSILQAEFSAQEVTLLLGDLWWLAKQSITQNMADAIERSIPAILVAIRMVKIKAGTDYAGQNSVGRQLMLTFLEPHHIGSEITNKDGNPSVGLYRTENNSVFNWDHIFITGYKHRVFPEQVIPKTSAIVHIGVSDSVQFPAVLGVRFNLVGIDLPFQTTDLFHACLENNNNTLKQLLPYINNTNIHLLKYLTYPSFVAFSQPILFMPGACCHADFFAYKTKPSNTKLISIVIGMAQDFQAGFDEYKNL